MLELGGIRFAHHGREPVADGLDIEVPPGRVHLLAGPSGCGKSTILRIAAGLIPRVQGGRIAGQARLAGRPVRDIPVAEMPRRIGWTPQDPEESFAARTVERELDQLARNLELPDPHHRTRRALEELGAEHLLDRPIDALSGGEAARVSLAAAGLGEPQALILDEPTAQLDQRGRKQVAAWVHDHAQRGARVLAAEHPPHPLDPDHVHRLGEPDDRPPTPELAAPGTGPPPLQLDAAVKRYEDGARIGPLDLSVAPGEIVCLTGPNGAGKTTALHLACGLLEPDQGSVRLRGEDPDGLAADELAARVGVAFQHPAWHITQDTVWEEVALTADELGIPADVEAPLRALGLAEYRDEHPWDLSGGERQRLAVATALAHDPPVLLLDEPTRGLDPESRARLAELLTQRAREGKATLIASHHGWLHELAHRTVDVEGRAT